MSMSLEKKSGQSLYRNKQWLIKKYWNEKKSLSDIAKETSVSSQTIYRHMKKFNISRRNISEANKEKIKRTPLSEKEKTRLRNLGKQQKIIIPKEDLIELYTDKKKNTREIAKIYTCSNVTVIARMNEYKISLRSPKERKSGSLNPSWGKVKEKSPRWRKKHSEKTKKILSQKNSGKNSPRWIPPEHRKETFNSQVRSTKNMKNWRFAVYCRDKFTCVLCGKKRNAKVEINADHIKPFSVILKDHNITNIEDAKLCNELWDINNGRTLCVECHKNTDTYGYKLQRFLKENNG